MKIHPFPIWTIAFVLSAYFAAGKLEAAPAPSITTQPRSQTNFFGSNVVFTVTASGQTPLFYRWSFNGANLTDNGHVSGSTATNLTIHNISTSDAGNYRVVVTNSHGSATSAVATLRVLVPAMITIQPTNQSVVLSNNVTFTAAAIGDAPLTYRWYFNGSALADAGRVSGSGTTSLNISNVQTNDAGSYELVATNGYGAGTSAVATLTVLVPSAITSQPQSQTVFLSSNVTFTATASGTAPLIYQWYFNGAPLTDGARISGSLTPSLTIYDVQMTDAGTYAVTVSNLLNVATSSTATLTPVPFVHYVNLNSTNPIAPYGDWGTAAVNIQDAVNAAGAGDLVMVTNGLYHPGSAVTVSTAISIVSVWGPAQTVIDGGGANRCVYLSGGAMLSGFTLTNGNTSQNGGDAYCETTNEFIANCVLIGGTAGVSNNGVGGFYGYGGGCYGGTLSNCTLIHNFAWQSGGGANNALLNNCVVASNSANNFEGGGVDACTVLTSTLSGNSAGQWGGNVSESTLVNCLLTNGWSLGFGGGAISSKLTNCTLSGNTSSTGGGAYSCTLSNCTLSANSGYSSGGGADGSTLINCLVISNFSAQGAGVNGCTMTNCVIQGNTMSDPYFGGAGGALNSQLYNCLIAQNSSVRGAGGASQCTLVNCTVAGNSAEYDGGGVDSSTLTNSIVYFNTSPVNGNYSGTNYMSWCCTTPLPGAFGDVVIGVSNLSSAPIFVDGQNGDYRLAVASPCLAAGNGAVVPVTVDLDGNPRTFAGTVDLGAYESPAAPFIAIQPADQTVPFGEPSVSFNVVVIGQGTPSYQWLFNGTNISNATNSVLVLDYVQYGDAGAYSVVVTTGYGTVVSSNAILTVVPPTPPSFTTQPTNQIVPVGTNIAFVAVATGAPAPVYRWYFDGVALSDDGHHSGTTGTSLQISNAQTSDTGNYYLVATNTGGAATSFVANVTVFLPAQILVPPASQAQLQGSNATFTVVVAGSPPLGYEWFFNGNPLADGGQYSGTTTTNLTISNLVPANAGNYVLVVTNNYSTATSAVATLTVLVPATITASPTNRTALLGSNVSFSVSAVGTAPLSYAWYFNGTAMTNGGRFSGATGSTLTISKVQTNDAGSYLVIVTNSYGSATSAMAELTVLVPAQITSQPASQAVLLGSNVTFAITAIGTGPLNYQWYFNGTALLDGGRISGSSTPALSISNVQSSDAGGYVAVVTNLYGSATSWTASLTPQAALEPSTRYVALASTNPMPPYLDWSTAATNIEDAIDAAVAGDSVIVSNGIYDTGTRVLYGTATNRVAIYKPLVVQSVNGPSASIIKGGFSSPAGPGGPIVRCAYLTNGALLAGFTLTNGGTSTSGDILLSQSGGGVWCESPSAIVSNCVFAGNRASQNGGGAYQGLLVDCTLTNNTGNNGGGAYGATLTGCTLVKNIASGQFRPSSGGGAYGGALSNCLVISNRADTYGGGAAFSTVTSCSISNNTAAYGGGACSNVLSNSILQNNSAGIYGGGSYGDLLYNCSLVTNTALTGGGAYSSTLFNCGLTNNRATGGAGGGAYQGALSNCVLFGNWAYNAGGGAELANLYSCNIISNSTAYNGMGGVFGGNCFNCVLRGNTGGAYNSTLYNCTVVQNSAVTGGGIFGGRVYNSVVYFNSAQNGSNWSGGVMTNCCTMPAPTIGAGNITNDPGLANLTGGDFHLQSNSPCINSGKNAYVTNSTDFDGNPRIAGGTVDIGAYEFQTPGSVISYAWLQQYGLPTDGSVDYADLDGTGFNVYQDWIAGLNPTNSASVLAMQIPVVNTNSPGLTVSWLSVSNRTYYLQRATNLAALPAFSTIQSNITGQVGTTSFLDTTATNGGPYFYRVGVQ